MIREVTGIDRIRMLYLQLLFRCNYTCRHCFHGDLLAAPDRYTLDEAQAILQYFRRTYDLQAVTFLGGEPLLYPDIIAISQFARDLALQIEMCSNGHRGFRTRITALRGLLDKLRVSLDGVGATHDAIRQPGSFAGALETIDHAVALGITTGATMTVTATNLEQVVPLARILQEHGAIELKLHALRLVGNAAANPGLAVADTSRYSDLHQQIADAHLELNIIYDSDLSPAPAAQTCSNLLADTWLDRIESDPRGALTVSCKAVGRDMHAFRWDKTRREITYQPRDTDELQQGIPDVVYVHA
jgi:MoaA/NifB/PqqE/SkfB family radical SAM enzyme